MPRHAKGALLNTHPVPLELFPELPPGAPAPKVRKPRAASAKAAPVPQPVAAPAPLVPDAAAPGHDAVEALALQLEAHGDYRVQRRLKPLLQWPGEATAGVTRIIVLDTETTGLDQSKERIIELAMLRVDIDKATGLPVGPVAVYDGLEDPGKPIPAEVVALTGIRDADVKGQQLDAARVAEMLEGVDLVVAHNAGFDRPFAEARFSRFTELTWACSFADIDWKAQGQGSAKLESLALAKGWFYDAHRAEMDCHALLAVLAQPLPTSGGTGLAQLIQAAQQPSYALQATNAPFEAKDKLKARGYRWHAEQRVWHTRLKSESELNAECAWLKEQVYSQRRAMVQIEKLDALVRFSGRAGVLSHIQL
jgi:DNA polymerase-3 subunit epsilon